MLRRASGVVSRMSEEKLREGLLMLVRDGDGRGEGEILEGMGLKGGLEGLGVAKRVRGSISYVEEGGMTRISYRVVGEWLGRGGGEFLLEFEKDVGDTKRELWEGAVELVLESTNGVYLSRPKSLGSRVEVEVCGDKKHISWECALGFGDVAGDFWLWTELD